jgi:hypothetical protein
LKAAAILVTDRESIEKVFDGVQTDPLEIGRAPRANPLEVLQRRLKERAY